MMQIEEMVSTVYDQVEWQRQPRQLDEPDLRATLHNMIIDSIRYLYIITGRAEQFGDSLFELEDGVPVALLNNLIADEYQLVQLHTMVSFLRKVQTDVNNIVGYTTDALSITNADKPYQYLSTTIGEYERQERLIYYKMTRYTLL